MLSLLRAADRHARKLRRYDFIRWYLLHDFATVFIDDGTWYLLVHTECRHLQPDNRCGPMKLGRNLS